MQFSSATPFIMKDIAKHFFLIGLAYIAIAVSVVGLATFVVCTVLKQFGVI